MADAADSAAEKLPSYDLQMLETHRQKFRDSVFFEFAGDALEGADFARLMYLINRAFPGLDQKAVWESVRNLAGQQMTSALITQTCWRLAGNLHRLRTGICVPPWHLQYAPEWVPVQVVSHTRINRRNKWCTQYRLRILAGTSCPNVMIKTWADSFARVVSGRLGFSAPWGKYPLVDLAELVNLRFYAYIEPAQCQGGRPDFERIACSQSMQDWNRILIKQRRRVDFKCPQGFEHQCFECPMGYVDCEPAVRRLTLIEGTHDADSSPDRSFHDRKDPS